MSDHHVRRTSHRRWTFSRWSYLPYDSCSTFWSPCSEAMSAHARLVKFNPSILRMQNWLAPVVCECRAYHTRSSHGVIRSTFTYNGCKPVLHKQNTQVKPDKPSICKYGVGTWRPKGRTRVVWKIRSTWECSPTMTSLSHVMIGHGLVDSDRVTLRWLEGCLI